MNTIFLSFDSEESAQTAENRITLNMNFAVSVNAQTGLAEPNKTQTQRWAIPALTNTGIWVFAKPEEQYMIGVSNYTEVEYDASWFTLPEDYE